MCSSISFFRKLSQRKISLTDSISKMKQRGKWIVFIAVVIMTGRLATCHRKTHHQKDATCKKSVDDVDPAIADLLIRSIGANNIEHNLK